MLELKIQASLLKKITLFIHHMKMNGRVNVSGPERFEFIECWKTKTELLECSPNQIALQAIDPSHASLLDLRLTPDAFIHYRCDRPMSLGIVPRNIVDILDFALDENDVVTVKADDCDSTNGYITFMLESDTNFYYALKLRKFNKDNYLCIPESIQYQAIVEMPSARFVRIIKSLIGDEGYDGNFTISVTNEGVKFRRACQYVTCRHDNRRRCDLSVDDKPEGEEEATVIKMVMNEAVSVESELSYLMPFTEESPMSHTVKINLCAEFPVMVEYKIAKRSWFRFHLAPIVDEDEDEDGPTEGGVPGQQNLTPA